MSYVFREFVQYDPRGEETLGRFTFNLFTLALVGWVFSSSRFGELTQHLRRLEVGEMYRMPEGRTILRRER